MIDQVELKNILEEALDCTVYLEQGITKDIEIPLITYQQINYRDYGPNTFSDKTKWMKRTYQINVYDTDYGNICDNIDTIYYTVKANYGDIDDYAEIYDDNTPIIKAIITASFLYKMN